MNIKRTLITTSLIFGAFLLQVNEDNVNQSYEYEKMNNGVVLTLAENDLRLKML